MLYQMCLLQTSSPSLSFIFSYSWPPFTKQKSLILMKLCLSIISSWIIPLASYLKSKSLPYLKSSRFSPMLSSRILQYCVLNLGLWPILCLWRVQNLSRFCLSFFFFVCGCLVVLALFVEKTVSAALYCFCSSVKGQLTICESNAWLCILFHWSICSFFLRYHTVLITLALY